MRLNNIIYSPILTEKTYETAGRGVYSFKVNMKATKGNIRENLKNIYNVEAIQINTVIMPGKPKRVLGTRGFSKTQGWKKAVVKLREGQSIDVFPKETK